MMQLFDDEYDYLVKTLLIGEPGVGKSTFCTKLNSGDFLNNYSSTIGVDFFCIYTDVDTKRYKLQIWDTAGQERFLSITRSYYRNSKIILLMFDLNDYDTKNIEKWINEIDNYCNNKYKVILIGNKLDLGKNINEKELNDIIKKLNLEYIEFSVKDNTDFKDFFELLYITINNLPKDYFIVKKDNLNIEEYNIKPSKKCCTIS
jgi:Ras-related protein Rab-1A